MISTACPGSFSVAGGLNVFARSEWLKSSQKAPKLADLFYTIWGWGVGLQSQKLLPLSPTRYWIWSCKISFKVKFLTKSSLFTAAVKPQASFNKWLAIHPHSSTSEKNPTQWHDYTARFSLHQVHGSQCTKEYYTKYSWRTLADVCMVIEVLRVVPRSPVLL